MQNAPPPPLVLASTSRYRHELLQRLRLPFEAVAPGVDETPQPGEPPARLAERLALAKARAVRALRPLRALKRMPGMGNLISSIMVALPRFAEDARYHQAQAWGARDMPSEPLAFIEWTMRSMLNPNRIAAAVSKVGPPQDQAQRDALTSALVEDIWEDLTREHDALLATLSSEDHLLLRAVLYDEAALAL